MSQGQNEFHPVIVKTLEQLQGKTFDMDTLLAAFESNGFNSLKAGFACREVWMCKAVKWRKDIGKVVSLTPVYPQ